MADLLLSDDLRLSIDAVTKTIGIIAQRRVGKTYTGSVLAEEMVAAGIPWVALDPTGAWFGIRSGADGKAKGGLPVIVLGGQHGDIPLEPNSGSMVADLVVDSPGWYVLDMSLFESRAAERRFAYAFADRFYRRKGQAGKDFAMHLFVDEADMFVPQRPGKGDELMVGAFNAIVRRGGIRGIGTTLITQRAAIVNKDVLEQIGILITLRVTGPRDRKAILDYVSAQGTAEEVAELGASLPSLRLGEAWVWEPAEGTFARIKVRARHTFNSSATPKAGETRVEPTARADIDLDAVREAMAETIERADKDDPVKLRAQIATLKGQLAEATKPQPLPDPVIEHVDRPVVDNDMIETIADGVAVVDELRASVTDVGDLMNTVLDTLRKLADAPPAPSPERPLVAQPPATRAATSRRAPAAAPIGDPAPIPDGVKFKVREQTILAVLAQNPGLDHRSISYLSGYSAKASTIGAGLTELRKAGYIDSENVATPEGIAALGDDYEPLPNGRELLDYWLAKLGKREAAILNVLVASYPAPTTREIISDMTGYSTGASTIGAGMTELRQLGFADGWSLHPEFAGRVGL